VRNGSQLDICLSNPPLEGPAGHATEKRTLAITGEIAVKDGRGAQVVVGNNRVVAKIYDPLYYLHNDGSVVRAIDDFTFLADSDYTREAAAYNELKAKFGGNEIPYFFGSWTCNISTPTPLGLKIRPVRLILIEYLQGTSLLELKPTLFSEQDRINIVARAMEASVAILHEGVHHRDFSPRNVMYCKLTDGKSIKSEPRIVIIDFGLSVVDRLASGTRHKDLFNLPTSPLTCYSGDTVDFSDLGWLPTSKDWMWARWDGSSQYKPVPDHIRKRRNEGPKDVQSILAKFLSK
jgi:serine/threonine protein kinase